MKKITFWLFLLFTSWQISAQTGTVVVGISDGSPYGTTEDGAPLQDWFKTHRVQYLYTAAELASAGLAAGNITEIGWVATNINASTLQENYSISMKSTTLSALTTTYETGATLVYGPTDFTPTAAGNVVFPLTTPFVWDGTSNIIIEVCSGLASGTYTQNVSCANFTTTTNQTVYFRSDNATSPCTTATGQLLLSKPLVVITGALASCTPPVNLVSGNITATSADLSWDVNTTALSYEYAVTTSSVAPATGTSTAGTIFQPTGLAPQTLHYLHVRSVCTGSVFSAWNSLGFTTACAPITLFSESFDVGITTPALPNCWSKLLSGASISAFASVNTVGFNSSTAPNAVELYNSTSTSTDNIMLVSPVLSNLSAGTHRLKFSARNTTDSEDIQIGVLTDPLDASTFTLVQDVDITGTYQVYSVNFNTFTGPGSNIAIRRLSTSTFTYVYLDNISWELIPTCPDQTGLTIGGITSDGANTSWDDLSPAATGYQYAVTTSVTPPVTGTDTASTFFIATGLAPQTLHYLHVRVNCGSSFGNWATTSFTTLCAPITTFPSLETFTTFLPNQCWSQANGGDLVAGPAAPDAFGWYADGLGNVGFVGAANFNLYQSGGNVWLLTPQFTIPATGYELKYIAAITQYGSTTSPTNWDTNDKVEVLVSTNGTTNWTPLFTYDVTNYTTISPSGSLNFIDLDAYAGQTVKFAFRAVEGAAGRDIDFSFDNFEVRLSPTCPDVTNITIGGITSDGANTSWDDLTPTATGYQYAVTTSIIPPAVGTDTASTFYVATGLASQTVHYLHVRAACAGGTFGNWATTSFTTLCIPISVLPWTEGFESLTSFGTTSFPTCWLEQATGYSSSNTAGANTPFAGTKYILNNSFFATNEFIWSPAFSLTAGVSYDFSSYVQGDGAAGWALDYFVNTAQNSTGATQLGATYTVPGNGTIAVQPHNLVLRSFVPTVTGIYYFATRVNQPNFVFSAVGFDNFEVKLSPACSPPTATATNVTGNGADLSWGALASATSGYEYVLDTTLADPTVSGTSISITTFTASSLLPLTTYYFHIRSACAGSTFSTWNTISFTTGCATVSAFPATETFVTFLPNCWEQQINGTLATGPLASGTLWYEDGLGNSALTGAANFNLYQANRIGWVLSPFYAVPTNYSLYFDAAITDYGVQTVPTLFEADDFVDVLVSTGSTNWVSLAQYNSTNFTSLVPAGTPVIIDLAAYANQTVRFAFRAVEGAANGTADVDFSFDNFRLDVTLGSDSFDKNNFVAYPNPVKDVLNLSYTTEITNVKVVNLLGQEVLNNKTNSNTVKVDMSTLNAGAYIVNITVNDAIQTIKVIKQ